MDEDERWEEVHPNSYFHMDALLRDVGYERPESKYWQEWRRVTWKKQQDAISLGVLRYQHSTTYRDIYKVIASTANTDAETLFIQVNDITPMKLFRRGIAHYECIVLNAIESMVRDAGRSDVSEGVSDE